MSRKSQLNASRRSPSESLKNNLGIVLDVILSEDHPYLKKIHEDTSLFEEKSLHDIGSVIIRPMWDGVSRGDTFPAIKPLDAYNTDYPIVGETVEIVYQGGKPFYKRISSVNINTGNAKPNADLMVYPKENEGGTGNSSDYKEVSTTGISNAGSNDQKRKSKFGKYFEYKKVNQLKPYEGDKIIQSRFGQSIRFSGYNNVNNVFSPTIIIRNNQGQTDTKVNTIIEEDINNDGSVILIGSGEYQSNFTATTSIGPEHFGNYPNELKGNQLIINSDRIIISSKSSEMIFHSKGNYGFISDGKFSIDNGKGADLDFGDNVNITTNRTDSNFSVLTGSGKVLLNTNEQGKSPNTDKPNEPLVRGNTLKEILETMIDLINAQVYKTPSGPTAIGPENKSDFNALKRRLSEMLSTLNYTE